MSGDNFSFIDDSSLRTNLNTVFELIFELTSILESKSYRQKQAITSSLRKTIIIYTASVIEALLYHIIKQQIGSQKICLEEEWHYYDQKIFHKLDDDTEIIGGYRKRITKDVNKIDFSTMIKLCKSHRLIKQQVLIKKLDRIRILRNRLHLGAIANIERKYTRIQLEFCNNVLEEVIRIIKSK